MPSKIQVDQIAGATGSTVTLPSGQTLDLSSGTVTLPNSAVNLTTKVTGTLPVANGGTGITALGTAGQVIKVNSGATGLEFGTAPSGKLLQVVSATKTDTFTTTSTGFVDVTGLSVSITPSSASNKILVFYSTTVSGVSGQYSVHLRLRRNSTDIYIGDTAGSRTRISSGMWTPSDSFHMSPINGNFLDNPSTTSATTYKLQLQSGYVSEIVYINRNYTDTNNAETSRTASTITAMEIGA